MPIPTELRFIAQKAALGKELAVGRGTSKTILWANEAIETARKQPDKIRESLKSGTEIGNQSLLLTEKLKTQVETIGQGTIDPKTGEKDPVRNKTEEDNFKKANNGENLLETLLEYDKLNPKKDVARINAIETRMVQVLESRPDGGELFFKNNKGVVMTEPEKKDFVKKMLKNGARELRSIGNENVEALLNDPNKPSSATEQALAALERYKDAEFGKENARIQVDSTDKEHQGILDDEQSFLDTTNPDELGGKLKNLSDFEPQRVGLISNQDVILQQLQLELDRLNKQQEQLVRIRTSKKATIPQYVTDQLQKINEDMQRIGTNIGTETGKRNFWAAQQVELAQLQERQKNLPKEKIRLGEAKRKSESEKVKADGVFSARSEEYRMAIRLKETTESYFADAISHLPDHIINTYLDGKMDQVAIQVEQAIPFINENIRQTLIEKLDLRHYVEKPKLLSWKWQPFLRKHEYTKAEELNLDWKFIRDGSVGSGATAVTIERHIASIIPKEWATLNSDQKKAATAVYAVEVYNRFKKMKQERFVRTKIFGQQIITDHDYQELKRRPWNKEIMEASAQANQQFKEAMEQKLPGVDLTTTEGKGRMWDTIKNSNPLYDLMMAAAITPSLFQEEKKQTA